MKNFRANIYRLPPFRTSLTLIAASGNFGAPRRGRLFLSALLFFSLFIVSCKPQISIKAGKSDEASIFFSTGFSDSTAKTLQNLTGADTNAPLFNKDDVLLLLKSAGAVNTSAALPTSNEISANGTIPEVSKNPLYQTGILSKTEKSLTFTLGPKQISAFYELLNDDAKSYLDLMMIPALIGEKMDTKEYTELLSSMYGPTFAEEIVSGKLTISLSSPDGRRTLKETITLGELLTATEEKSWSIKF